MRLPRVPLSVLFSIAFHTGCAAAGALDAPVVVARGPVAAFAQPTCDDALRTPVRERRRVFSSQPACVRAV